LTALLRTIRLDGSDAVVFDRAAAPGEWAVTGTFLFAGLASGEDIEALPRKARVAFRSGFAGIASFGFSTLAVVTKATEAERREAVAALADALVLHLGAPDAATALPAAEEEIALAHDLARDHAEGTLIALHRTVEDGAIRERFRSLRPRSDTAFGAPHLGGHDRAFDFFETDDEEGAEDGGGRAAFDLKGLAQEDR
jgi:hypothetical protein